MSLKPFTLVGGIVVGEGPSLTTVVLANGDVTTNNITVANNANLGSNANVIITGGSAGYVLATNGSGNLSWQNPSLANINNGSSNVSIASSGGNVTTSVGGVANVFIVTTTGANVTGTFNSTGNIIAANANLGNIVIANYFSGSGNNLSNIQGSNVTGAVSYATTANSVAGANVSGTVANATYADSAGTAGTVTTNAQPNITSVGNLTGLTVSNTSGVVNLSNTANVTLGSVSNLHISGGTTGQYLQTDGSGVLSWSTVATGSTSNISNGNSNVSIATSNGNITMSAVGNANIVVVTGTGANINGYANITGNVALSGDNVSLGSVSNLHIAGGSNTYVLSTDGAGNLSWTTASGTSIGVDNFTGNGVQTSFTLSTTPANVNCTIVSLAGLFQPRTVYSLVGDVITFSSPPPNTAPIEVTTFTAVTGGSGSSNIENGNSNVSIATTNGNITMSAVGNANIVTVTGTGVNVAGTLNVTKQSNLGVVGNVIITGGTSGQYLQTDGTGVLSWSSVPTGTGISNGNSNVNIATSNGNVTIAAAGNTTMTITGTGANITGTANISGNANVGNIGATNGVFTNVSGNGSSLSSLTGANVTGYVADATHSNVADSANAVAGANVSGQVGNALVAGTVYTAAQPNITSVGTLTSLIVGNSTANSTFGNGTITLTSAGNIDAGNLLTTNNLSVTSYVNSNLIPNANITYTLGNSTNRWKDLWLSNSTIYFASDSTISAGTISFGNSNISIPTVDGNVTISATGNSNVVVITGTGVNVAGTLNTGTGIISGNGSGLSSLTGANVTGQVNYAATANSVAGANVTGQVNYAATANSVAGANVSGAVAYATTANSVAGGNVSGAVSYATTANSVAGANVSGQVSNALISGTVYTNAQPNITSVGTLTSVSVSGNANVGNLGTNNFIATGTGSFGANVNMNGNWINNVGYPSATTDAATKAYVDTMVSSGIAYHQPVAVATTTTLATATGGTTSYVSPNGAANGIGAYISTTGTYLNIDGANVQTVGTRILVKDEANATWNGVYTYANTTAIVRSSDTDEYGPDSTEQLSINDYFFVQGGVVNKGIAYIVSAPAGTITFGTSNIVFSQFSSSQVYTAGTGLTLTDTTFSVNASQTQITSVGTLTGLAVNGNITAANITANTGVFTGNGNGLSSLVGANVTGQVANALVSGTVYTNAQPNITSVGTLTSLGVNGTITATAITANTGVFTGNGSGLSSIAGGNVTGQVANALVSGTVYTNAQPNITSVGTLTGITSTGTANFTGASNVSLGPVANVHISGGTNGQYLQTDGSGTLTWANAGSTSNISNGNSNVSISTANGNITISAVGNANIVTVTGTGVNVAGTLNVTKQSNLGPVGNVIITGGTANYVLSTDGAGNLSWAALPAGANVTVDNFTGNGVQTVFTLSTTPTGINQTSVNYNGATVLRTDYTLAGANITFSSAPANGSLIEVTTINLITGSGGGGSAAASVGYSLIFGG